MQDDNLNSVSCILGTECAFFCLVVELQSNEATPETRTLGPADVFVSYCWVNSEKAHKSMQVRVLMGRQGRI